jgi:hypothetical protein
MIRKDFIGMDDRLWSPEEWAAWLRYVDTVNGKRIGVEIHRKDRRNETAVIGEKDSRFVKRDSEA